MIGPKVFMIPKNHEYINRMKEALESVGVDVQILKPFHWSTAENLIKFFKYWRKGYNIIHVHWLYIFPFGIIMKLFILFCKIHGVKVIWEMHNILPHNYNISDLKTGKWFYERVDAIIFHSNDDIERSKIILRTCMDKKHIVIPHGNFNKSYENDVTKSEARERLRIGKDKRVILCFGFIRKNRGYEYLLEATEDMDNLVILIAGKVWERKVYNRLVEEMKNDERIKIISGWIPDEDVQLFFKASDFVALPYTEITTSGVIPLSYSFKRPVIASAIGGVKDVVNEKTGILVPPKDSDALREGINRMFEKDLVSMGEDCFDYAEREFNWRHISEGVKSLYLSLLD